MVILPLMNLRPQTRLPQTMGEDSLRKRRRPYDRSINMERGEIRRSMAAVLGLWALFANLAAALILPLSASAARADIADNGQMMICTGTGMIMLASAEASGSQDPQQSPKPTEAPCIFCLPLMHSALEAPTPELSAPRFGFEASPAPARLLSDHHPEPVFNDGSTSPRGPPRV